MIVLLHEVSSVRIEREVFCAVCVLVCSEVERYDGIQTIITLVNDGQPDAVECALSVLINMSTDETLFMDILYLNVIPALINALSSQLVLSVYSLYPISLWSNV